MKKAKQILGMALGLVIGGAGGFFFAEAADRSGLLERPADIFWLVLSAFLSFYAAIILHEGGHLVCALLSGYRFVSFRVGSMMLIRNREGFQLKRFSLAGTGGQCLMEPPAMEDGEFPNILYNAGGVLANFLTALICAGLYLLRPNVPALVLGFFSLLFALTNGIPMSTGGINNDGKNLFYLKRNGAAARGLWLQLAVNARLVQGERIRELPSEWFEPNGGFQTEFSGMTDALTATAGSLRMTRAMDEGRLEEARDLGRELLEKATGLLPIQRSMIEADVLFLELLGGEKESFEKRRREKDMKRFLKLTKTYPSTVRWQYAGAKLADRDEKRAGELREEFERVVKRYPNAGELPTERELMALVDARAAEN